jgi:hypothetical protein
VVESPNRDLLIEFCTNFDYAVSNTWQTNPPHMQVNYHELAAPQISTIQAETFATLDLLLFPARALYKVLSFCSDRLGCIASHHFPIVATLDAAADRSYTGRKGNARRWELLRESATLNSFVSAVGSEVGRASGTITIDDTCIALKEEIVRVPKLLFRF